MDLVRTSPKGKWHVPGAGLDRCPQLTRAYGYDAKPLPVESVRVLGDYDFCARCAHRAGPPGPAGVLFAACGLVLAAAAWVADLEAAAGRMDWLEVARWGCQTPFGPPDPMPDLLARL